MQEQTRQQNEPRVQRNRMALGAALVLSSFTSPAPAAAPGTPPAPHATQLASQARAFTSTTGAIPNPGVLSGIATAVLSKPNATFGDLLWDVDVHVTINHPRPQDLEVIVIAPSTPGGLTFNRIVTLSTGNGGSNANAYQGNIFDDSADLLATDATALTTPGTFVVPEGALTSLQYINPWGTWEVRIRDTDGSAIGGMMGPASVGSLMSFQIDATVLDPGYVHTVYGPTTGFITTSRPISDTGATLSEPAIVGGAGINLAEARVFVKLTHSAPSELDIVVSGPNGDTPLSLRNGGTDGACFDGTLWYDGARTPSKLELLTTASSTYTTPGTKTDLVPHGALGRHIGEDPLYWTLRITDRVPGNGSSGTLTEFGVTCWTFDAPVIAPTCISGTSFNNCTPTLSWSGGGLQVSGVDNNRTGVFFYGVTGSHVVPWGSSSTLCVKTPVQRTGAICVCGLPPGPFCDGFASLSWSGYSSANPFGLYSTVPPSTLISAQFWWRDPMSFPKTSQLTNMVQFVP